MTNTDDKIPAKRRLGRGLNALLGAQPQPEIAGIDESDSDLKHIAIDAIEPNPFQPRRDFDETSLNELIASIKQHGILQPLLVRQADEGYQLIAGERRWIAAGKAGLSKVPCQVVILEDQEVSDAAIEENLKRRDLNVLEKAQAFHDYLERFDVSIEELARRLSMNRSNVSNMLRLLELPEVVQVAVRAGKISYGHARALLPLDEPDQIALCKRIETESLSVRQTEVTVREQQGKTTIPFEPKPEPTAKPQPTNHVLSLQDQLRDALGAKVEIQLRGEESGKIIIQFQSNDEFERILRTLRHVA